MTNTITVYRVNDTPVELDPSLCVFVDRTRMEDGVCPMKRLIMYHEGGRGYVPNYRNDHLRIGSATHEGLDLLHQGGTLEKALVVAEMDWLEEPHYGNMPMEQQDILLNDGLHMVKAFIYSYYHKYLPLLFEEYEVVEVEEETNWLLVPDFDLNPTGGLVIMSRPDTVLRKLSTGRLWHMSHKTLGQKFDDKQLDKLKVDIQRFSEGYAIWAKYGEAPEGTLYNYFLKGDRRYDKDTGLERYTTGLIRPWMNTLTKTAGEPTPEDLSYVYEWDELDQSTMQIKGRRLGKGWEKVDIWAEMEYLQYLDMLKDKTVARQGRDYLAEIVMGLVPMEWNVNHAERWRIGTANKEGQWAWKMDHLAAKRGDPTYLYEVASEVPLESSECFDYNSKCTFYDHCWKDVPLDQMIQSGRIIERTPNHLVELSKPIR